MKSLKTLAVRFGLYSICFTLGYFISFQSHAQEKSLLWKIEGEGIAPSYLFGTFHIMPQSDFVLNDKVINSLEKCSQLVMELNMGNPNLQMEVMRLAGMKNSQTLDQLLNEEEYNQISDLLKEEMGIGLAQVNTMKPFMISSLLIKRYVGDQPASFESVLATHARSKNMKIEGLETPEEQMAVFDEIPYQTQAKELVEMVTDEEAITKLYDKMIRLYKEEHFEEIFNLSAQYFDDPGELELILTDRNEKWIPRFENLAKEDVTFFAVGAGHLGGEKGLIKLLQANGYTLKPVE